MMLRNNHRFISILLLSVLLLSACGKTTAPTAQVAPTSGPVVSSAGGSLIFEGKLVPNEKALMAFEIAGKVGEILVEEGDTVQKGDTLAQLEAQEDLQAAVAKAEAELLDAQQALDDLNTSLEVARGVALQQISSNASIIHQTSTRLSGMSTPADQAGMTQLEVVQQMQARLDKARAAYQPYRDYDTAVDPFSGYFAPVGLSSGETKVVSKLPLISASPALLIAAQNKFYDVILPTAPGETVRVKPIPALRNVSKENINKIYPDKTKSRADIKNQSYNYLSSEEKLKFDLKKEYEQALKDYNLAITRLSLNASLSTAQSALDNALQDYQELQAGPDPAMLAKAQNRLAAAQATLAAAQAELRKTSLVSPISGKVVKVDVVAGEQVQPFQVIITVADFSRWYVETENLTEIDVVDIRQGQPVSVTADALPELKMQGTVDQINQVFEEKSGDVTYTTRILLDQVDPHLRWGMTTLVVAQK